MFKSDEFVRLTAKQPLLGLDLGTKTIGLARTDPEWRIVVPMTTLARTKFSNDLVNLIRITQEEAIGGIILGLPINMDGSEGRRAQSTRAFARNLAKHNLPPILFWDERLSTFSASEHLSKSGLAQRKHKQKVDSTAAAIILENALTHINHFDS